MRLLEMFIILYVHTHSTEISMIHFHTRSIQTPGTPKQDHNALH